MKKVTVVSTSSKGSLIDHFAICNGYRSLWEHSLAHYYYNTSFWFWPTNVLFRNKLEMLLCDGFGPLSLSLSLSLPFSFSFSFFLSLYLRATNPLEYFAVIVVWPDKRFVLCRPTEKSRNNHFEDIQTRKFETHRSGY
jgi:hypothetical protein